MGKKLTEAAQRERERQRKAYEDWDAAPWSDKDRQWAAQNGGYDVIPSADGFKIVALPGTTMEGATPEEMEDYLLEGAAQWCVVACKALHKQRGE